MLSSAPSKEPTMSGKTVLSYPDGDVRSVTNEAAPEAFFFVVP